MGRTRRVTLSVLLALVTAGCTAATTAAQRSAVPSPSRSTVSTTAAVPIPTSSPVTAAPSESTASPTSSPAPTWHLTVRPAACLAKHLTARFDLAHSGGAGGTEGVVILFRNTGTTPCWLSGLPRLTGVDANGRVTALRFLASRDQAYALAWPANGPGAVFPGGLGALHLEVSDNSYDCTIKGVLHQRLDIALRWHQVLSIPFPAELAVTGCLGGEAEIGPVAFPLD